MEAIDFLGALMDERFAIAGKITKGTNGRRRNEGSFEQAMAQEIGNPFTVFNIRVG